MMNISTSDLQQPVVPLEDGIVAVHNNYKLDTARSTKLIWPLRSKLNRSFGNASDFVKFVAEYKEDGSKAFYDDTHVEVVFNYPLKDNPNFGDSTASLRLERTTEFNTFSQGIGQELTQKEFIRYLKQIEPNVTSHDGIALFNIVENLKAVKNVNSITKNAEKGISLNVKVDSGVDAVTVPEKITLRLPMYKATPEEYSLFELELFYDYTDSGGFIVTAECWQYDHVVETDTRKMVESIVGALRMNAYRV